MGNERKHSRLKESFDERIERKRKSLIEYMNSVSEMDTPEKLSELSELMSSEDTLTERLNIIRSRIDIVKSMEDVAEYRSLEDNIAMRILTHLKDNEGSIPYSELTKGVDANLTTIYFNRLNLLKSARFVDWVPDPGFNGDYKINLTDKGREFDVEAYVKNA